MACNIVVMVLYLYIHLSILAIASYGKTGFLLLDTLYARGGDTALHMAARNGKMKCSLQLIIQGSDCFATNHDKKTPKELAQRNNRIIHKGLADIQTGEKQTFARLVAKALAFS